MQHNMALFDWVGVSRADGISARAYDNKRSLESIPSTTHQLLHRYCEVAIQSHICWLLKHKYE